MNEYEEKAIQYHSGNYNCAQAMTLAFKDELGLDEPTLLRLASSFGGGMGGMGEICGVINSMFMIWGLKYGYSNNPTSEEKRAHNKELRTLAEKFRAENGSLNCRELIAMQKATGGSCASRVGSGARILAEAMANR
jgi:C_GCAxxG_C_C family probable redox protein